jgi:hypothetical protein
MPLHSSPRGPVIRKNQEARHTCDPPAAFSRDLGRDTHLSIERAKHRLQVRHDRLDLDDEQRSARFVKGEDVDRPAVSAHIERDFGDCDPSRRLKQLQNALGQVSVGRIKQSIESFSVPQHPDAQGRPECRRDADERVHGDPIGLPVLDPTDDRSRYADGVCESLLRPSPSTAKCPHRQAEPDHIHGAPSVVKAAYPGLI